MLTEEIHSDIENSVLCWLATADPDGHPNVSPKELFCADGDAALVIAEVTSPNSVRNIRANPAVCVSFVDVFRQHGFKMTGRAELIESGTEDFAKAGTRLLDMAGPDFRVRRIIRIRIDRVARIWAPSYRIFPDRSVEEQMRRGYETYGVRPV